MFKKTHVSRRIRLMVAALACGFVASAAGGAAVAGAAGPDYLNTFDSVRYPTWGWGSSTTICAYNHGYEWGHVYVDPVYGDARPDQMWVSARSTNCLSRSWWGNPVDVVNNGATPLTVWSR